jgi:hypothetical protein
VTIHALIGLYLAVGGGCAALAFRTTTGTRWQRGARAAAMVIVWPLWAPFVLLR